MMGDPYRFRREAEARRVVAPGASGPSGPPRMRSASGKPMYSRMSRSISSQAPPFAARVDLMGPSLRLEAFRRKTEGRVSMTIQRQIVFALVLACAAALGAVVTWADVPGYLFMDIDNHHAMVVRQQEQKAQIFKAPAKLPENLAASIAEGGQPVGDSVIVVYNGQLYIIPDKKIGNHMASHMVMREAGAPLD